MIDPSCDLLKILNVQPSVKLCGIAGITDGNTLQQVDNRWICSRGSFRRSWHRRRLIRGLSAKPGPLITGEEKGLVLFDGAAECAASLIALERILDCPSARPRVEGLVAQEFECVPMELVRARASDDVHHGAGVLTVLSAVVTGLYAEFLQGIRHGEWLVHVGVLVNIVATVQLIADLALPRSV